MATTAESQLFIYRGKNRKGEKVQGEIKADTLIAVRVSCASRGLFLPRSRKNPNRYLAMPKKLFPGISRYLLGSWPP